MVRPTEGCKEPTPARTLVVVGSEIAETTLAGRGSVVCALLDYDHDVAYDTLCFHQVPPPRQKFAVADGGGKRYV